METYSEITPELKPKQPITNKTHIILLVFTVLIFLGSLISLAIATTTILIHTTTVEDKIYKDEKDFTNLTVEGTLQVKGNTRLKETLDVKNDYETKDTVEAFTVQVKDSKLTLGGEAWTTENIANIKTKSDWFQIFLTSPITHTVPSSTQTNYFPFARILNLNNLNAVGPAKHYFRIVPEPANVPTQASIADFTGDESVWIVEGRFKVNWGGTIPDSITTSEAISTEKINLTDTGDSVYLSSLHSHAPQNQMYSFASVALKTPSISFNGKSCNFFGMYLLMVYPLPHDSTDVTLTDFTFTFKRLR